MARRKAATKPKPTPEVVAEPYRARLGEGWRVRPISGEGPHKWPRPAHYTDDRDEAEQVASEWEWEGVPCIVEVAVEYGYRAWSPPPLTVAQLGAEGLAQQRPGNVWIVSPEGQRRLLQSMAVPRG